MSKKINKTYNWLSFSQSYLHLAMLGCKEMLDSKHKKEQTGKFGVTSKLTYKKHDIFIPTLYNVKHGIESFIKTLKLVLAEKLSKGDLNHNVSELFDMLKQEIKRHKIVEVIRKKYKEDSEDINLEIAYNNKIKIQDFLDDIERLILKYYHCEILKEKLGSSFSIEDVDNTAFRYPDNNLKIDIDYESVLGRITNEDIEIMMSDIDTLHKNFNALGFILEIYKQHAKKNTTK